MDNSAGDSMPDSDLILFFAALTFFIVGMIVARWGRSSLKKTRSVRNKYSLKVTAKALRSFKTKESFDGCSMYVTHFVLEYTVNGRSYRTKSNICRNRRHKDGTYTIWVDPDNPIEFYNRVHFRNLSDSVLLLITAGACFIPALIITLIIIF